MERLVRVIGGAIARGALETRDPAAVLAGGDVLARMVPVEGRFGGGEPMGEFGMADELFAGPLVLDEDVVPQGTSGRARADVPRQGTLAFLVDIPAIFPGGRPMGSYRYGDELFAGPASLEDLPEARAAESTGGVEAERVAGNILASVVDLEPEIIELGTPMSSFAMGEQVFGGPLQTREMEVGI